MRKNLNRAALLAMLLPLFNAEHCTPSTSLTNSYVFSRGEVDIAEVQFIPKSKRYTYIIHLRCMTEFISDEVHEAVVKFVADAKLGKDVCVDSDYKRTMV